VAEQYAELASVYDWLVPDEQLTPEGSAAGFDAYVDLEPGARVLDCAAGTGTLAVGLALRGMRVVATDASEAMIARARALAAERRVGLPTQLCTWEELRTDEPFDAVFCVGNSLAHAEGRAARGRALAAMASVLRPGGVLVLTSRNWEQVREPRARVYSDERDLDRGGRRVQVIYTWTLAHDWDERHHLHIAIQAVGDEGRAILAAEQLAFWPFRHETLDDDLRAARLEPVTSTYDAEVDRYLVTARR
jgi:SAM-dependent methyltransferase